MALSWLNVPCAVKAAIGIGKRTLATLAAPTACGRGGRARRRILAVPAYGPALDDPCSRLIFGLECADFGGNHDRRYADLLRGGARPWAGPRRDDRGGGAGR